MGDLILLCRPDSVLDREAPWALLGLTQDSGNFAMLTAILRASSLLSNFADLRLGSSSK
jgi:hypothetical protein